MGSGCPVHCWQRGPSPGCPTCPLRVKDLAVGSPQAGLGSNAGREGCGVTVTLAEAMIL